jgi:hypothetical protein
MVSGPAVAVTVLATVPVNVVTAWPFDAVITEVAESVPASVVNPTSTPGIMAPLTFCTRAVTVMAVAPVPALRLSA